MIRTNLENWILTEMVRWKWARSPNPLSLFPEPGTSVCYWNHIRNALSTGDLGVIFICGINCLDSWKPASISLLWKWLRFRSWCLCLLHYQRQAKYSENKLKSIKARNEYLLTLEATNASVFKYYIHDLSDLIDVSTWRFIYRKYHSLMRIIQFMKCSEKKWFRPSHTRYFDRISCKMHITKHNCKLSLIKANCYPGGLNQKG